MEDRVDDIENGCGLAALGRIVRIADVDDSEGGNCRKVGCHY